MRKFLVPREAERFLRWAKKIAISDGPFSGPCASRACGHWRQPCPTDGEAYSEIAHLFPSYPKGLRQSCAWENSEAWAAHHYRRRVGTWELPVPVQTSLGFQLRERCGCFPRER